MATTLAGKPLVEASWALLKRDPSIIALLVVGSLAASVAFALVALPLYAVFGLPTDGRGDWSSVIVYALALFASTLVSTFFLGAVVAAAMQRADGGDPTFRSALAAAWERRAQLIAWAALSTVVGVALRQLERFGIAGQIVRLLAGVGWAVATWFAIPVIMAEGTMPFETIRRSGNVLTSKFGSNVRATIRLGIVYVLLWLAVLAVGLMGLFAFVDGVRKHEGLTTGLGLVMIVVALVGGFVVMACWQATSVYLRTVLYRYAAGLPTPGVGTWVLPPLLGGPDPAYAGDAPTWTFAMTEADTRFVPPHPFDTPTPADPRFAVPASYVAPAAPEQGGYLAPPPYVPPQATDVLPADDAPEPAQPAPPTAGPWPGSGVFLPTDPRT
ncbi:DUF6159 family protein [Longivirga aurantiaca]|uniref:DUF6159 family protein n=1 Tax=Longivirga aurantiaca TaxID=1837743 RepID=A0ABW1SV81_9ACTN